MTKSRNLTKTSPTTKRSKSEFCCRRQGDEFLGPSRLTERDHNPLGCGSLHICNIGILVQGCHICFCPGTLQAGILPLQNLEVELEVGPYKYRAISSIHGPSQARSLTRTDSGCALCDMGDMALHIPCAISRRDPSGKMGVCAGLCLFLPWHRFRILFCPARMLEFLRELFGQ